MNAVERLKQDREVFRTIFVDHWDWFKAKHPKYDTDQYIIPVQKMLDCGKEGGGYAEYRCPDCGLDTFRVAFSCKSCFCLSCSKLYVDEFVSQIGKMLHPGVVYRHIVLTVPEQLRAPFYQVRDNGDLLSEFMRIGYRCLEDVISTVLRRTLKIGAMVVVQTHGRSGRYNPHLHIIMTNGGIHEGVGSWFDLRFFRYEIIHTKWQYHLLRMVKEWFQRPEMNSLVDKLWKKYPRGLVAHVSKGEVPEGGGGLAKYLAKYVASPPIAVRRIIEYTGSEVTYWYKDHKSKSKQVETVSVEVFIGRMVQHILPKGFQRVRYYGLQATKTFNKWASIIAKGIMVIGRAVKGAYRVIQVKRYKERYVEVSNRNPWICSCCGGEMRLWKIWHPDYGLLFDEYERIKNECMLFLSDRRAGGGGGYTVRPTPKRIQLSLFAL